MEEIAEEEIEGEIEEADRYTFDIKIALAKLSNVNAGIAGTADKTAGNSSQSQLNPNAFEFTIGNNQVNFPPTHISASGLSSNSCQFHKLPKLNMPTFDGSLLNWQSFGTDLAPPCTTKQL